MGRLEVSLSSTMMIMSWLAPNGGVQMAYAACGM